MLRRFRFSAGSALLLTGICAVTACSSNHGWQSTGGSDDATLAVAPKWATPANYVGPMDPSAPIKLQVHLAMRDTANAEAELAAISDPDNALYGQFLTDEEFNAKYAPTAADVAAVQAHLEKSGLTVKFVPGNNAFVSAEGHGVAGREGLLDAARPLQGGGDAVKRAPMADMIAAPVAARRAHLRR